MSHLEAASECVRQIAIEIPWKDVADRRAKLLKGVRKTAVAPGFRRGYVPSALLHRMYQSEILTNLKEGLAVESLIARAAERKWNLAGIPTVDEVLFKEGGPLLVKGTMEVFPEFELGEYRDLKLVVPDYPLTNEILENHLNRLQVQHASYRNVDPRPIQDGDAVVLSVTGSSGGPEPEVDLDEMTVMVGSERNYPEFNDALPGLAPGERCEFDIAYPEVGSPQDLAGKTVHYQAEVLGIRKRELPDLDDEFAKDVSNQFETLDDLKQRLRLQIEEQLRAQSTQQARNQLMWQLAELHPMPLPSAYIESRIRENADEKQGLARSEEAPQEELRAAAEMTVRAELVLDRIAEVEQLKVPQEVVDGEIRRYAESERKTPDEARKELAESGVISWFRRSRLREMAFRVVFDEADRTTVPRTDHETSAERVPEAAAGA